MNQKNRQTYTNGHSLWLDPASKSTIKGKSVFNCRNCPTGYTAYNFDEAYEMASVRPCPRNMVVEQPEQKNRQVAEESLKKTIQCAFTCSDGSGKPVKRHIVGCPVEQPELGQWECKCPGHWIRNEKYACTCLINCFESCNSQDKEEEIKKELDKSHYDLTSWQVDEISEFISQVRQEAKCKRPDPNCPCWLDGFNTAKSENWILKEEHMAIVDKARREVAEEIKKNISDLYCEHPECCTPTTLRIIEYRLEANYLSKKGDTE